MFVGVRGQRPGYWTPYVTPPPVAWLVSPLSHLPFAAAWGTWTLVVAAAVVAAAWLLAPGAWSGRALVLLLFLATSEGLIGIPLGNLAAILLLAVAACARLSGSRPYLAGLVLAVLALKPQVALLVLPALLVAGYWRVVAGGVVGIAVLAGVSAASLGAAGIADYRHLLTLVSSFRDQQTLSIPHALGSGWAAWLVVGSGAILALAAARLYRSRGPGAVIAFGLVGSLMVAPYVNSEDFVLLAAAAVLLFSAARSPAEAVLAAVVGLSSTVLGSGSVIVPLLAELSLLLGALLLRQRDGARPATVAAPNFTARLPDRR